MDLRKDYARREGWKETIRLLSGPANARRLLSALAQAEAGELKEHDLIEELMLPRSTDW